ncbi:MAG: hypothetical protein HY023_09130 [Chloroflexi bacterium]|nr:hypothetical protein [Chloroflexota bacterium]
MPTPLHPPQSLKLNVWAESPILPLGQGQTLHAQVMNEQNVAVVGASVVTIIHTSGGDLTFVRPLTSEDGQTSVTFVLSAWNAGAFVTYEMRATYQSLTSEPARDSFVQWFGATPTPTPSS